MKSSNLLAGGFTLVVVAIVAVIFVGHDPSQPVPTSRKPSGDLASQFIASLVRDLETAKAAGMPLGKIQQLTDITQLATREFSGHTAEVGLANSWRFSWYDSLLAVGSKESIELALALMKQDAREREAAMANDLSEGENTGQSATQKLLEARTAADLDPVLRQLQDFTGSTSSNEATKSTVYKDLLRLLEFANRWQLQLYQRETGQSQQALKTLQAIAQNDNIPRWLHRSVFLREFDAASRAAGKVPADKIQPQITQIASKALTATTGEEIDKLLLEAGKLQEAMGNDDLLRLSFCKLTEFLKNLQDAIMALETHDSAKLRSSLSLLEAYYPDFDQHLGVPRSPLLRRVNDLRQTAANNIAAPSARTEEHRPETVLAKMVNLDSIQPHLSELKDSCVGLDPAGHPNWTMIQMLLDAFSTTAARLKAGHGMDRAVFENPLDPAVPQLRELQRQFDLLCMNISFAAETGLLPAAQESPEDYAKRLKTKLVEKQRWDLLRTLATACQAVKTTAPVISQEDRQALDSFLYGMRQQQDAKDFRTATMAYQSVLTSPSQLIPPDQVGARLESLRQIHPKEYQSGIDDALTLNKGESMVLPGARQKQLVWNIPGRKPR